MARNLVYKYWHVSTSGNNKFFFFGCHVNNIKWLGTQYQKIWDQIDKFKMLGTKLTYSVKVRDQICSLPFNLETHLMCY